MVHGAAAGLADVLREGAGLHPGDDLVLAIRTAHATGRFQRDEATLGTSRTHTSCRGSLEVDGATLRATDGTGGCGGGSRAGSKQQAGESCEGQEGGADEFGLHGCDMVAENQVLV